MNNILTVSALIKRMESILTRVGDIPVFLTQDANPLRNDDIDIRCNIDGSDFYVVLKGEK